MAPITSHRNPGAHPPQPSGADAGWGVTSTLMSGMLFWGGIGWLLDLWLDSRWFTVLGVLLGVGLGVYMVVVKYGSPGAAPRGDAAAPPAGTSPSAEEKGRR